MTTQQHDLTPVPEEATLLGEADGITFAQIGDYVWMRSYKTWRMLCTLHQWPHTASYAAVQEQKNVGERAV